MKSALVSGEANILAVTEGTAVRVYRNGDQNFFKADARDLSILLSGAKDVERLELHQFDDPHAVIEKFVLRDQAIRLFTILLDYKAAHSSLDDIASTLEEIISESSCQKYLLHQIFCHEIPKPIDIIELEEGINKYPQLKGVIRLYFDNQGSIRKVRQAFEAIPDIVFEGTSRDLVREFAIDKGLFFELANSSPADVNKTLFAFYNAMKSIKGYRNIVSEWTKSFEKEKFELPKWIESDDQSNIYFEDDMEYHADRSTYERVRLQISAIISKIRSGDFENARRYAKDLVKDQSASGTNRHIAKSMTFLSQAAKSEEHYDLQLEWANEAIKYSPNDPWTHCQAADAYVNLRRYSQANEALKTAEHLGEVAYSANSQARIARAQGNLGLAEELYEQALIVSKGNKHEVYSRAGLAEVARDQGRFDLALQRYDTALAELPYEAALHCGRAATLVDLGRFDDAESSYKAAMNFESNDVVPRTGIATIYREKGQFDISEKLARLIINERPNNSACQCLLGDVLRLQGNLTEALKQFEHASNLFPFNPIAFSGICRVLDEQGNISGSHQKYQEGISKFPYYAQMIIGLSSIKRRLRSYEEGLHLLDEAAHKFPKNLHIKIERAGMLRRLNYSDQSLSQYEEVLSLSPNFQKAANGKASLLISMARYDEAWQLLSKELCVTEEDWKSQVIIGLLYLKRDGILVAEPFLKNLVSRVPFSRERRFASAVLASIAMSNNDIDRASSLINSDVAEATNIIQFHVFAASKRAERADRMLRDLRDRYPHYHAELREEIARKFGIVNEAPSREQNWIYEREREMLLLEIA